MTPLVFASAQSITLAECYEKAEALSPLKRQESYIATINELNRMIESNAYLPGIVLKGSATYQSDVFKLPFNPPGAEIPLIPKDQYQFTLNVTQNIYDGGLVKSGKQIVNTDSEVRKQQLAVSLYQVRGVINELFFGLLTQQAHEKITLKLMDELANQSGKVSSGITNGILLPSVSMEIRKEYLLARQQLNTIQFNLSATRRVLSEWVGIEISEATELIIPSIVLERSDLQRPEIDLFINRGMQMEANKSILDAYRKPKIMAFANLGYGSPNALNFFETEWSSYYMVGGKLEWNLWDWNTIKKRKQVLDLNHEIINSEKENFERQVSNQMIQQNALVQQLETAIVTDSELLQLQKKIAEEAEYRFSEGVISASDYLTALNSLNRAELSLDLHQIQILKTKVDYQTISGDMN